MLARPTSTHTGPGDLAGPDALAVPAENGMLVTVADVQAEFASWVCWEGTDGLFYARRPQTPAGGYDAHGDDPADLREAILEGIGQLGEDTWDIPALPGERAALDAMQWNWGEAYEIGCEEGQWWYRRKDGQGGRETAATPDELHAQIVLDYSLLPVRRDPSADGDTRPVTASGQAPGPAQELRP
ncbi:MAG: hypothetical protein ACRDNF_17120 [Streptosporangiaceae bacterium]